MWRVTKKNKLFTVIFKIEEYSVWYDRNYLILFQNEPNLSILCAVAFRYSVVVICLLDLVPDLCGQVLRDLVAEDSHLLFVPVYSDTFKGVSLLQDGVPQHPGPEPDMEDERGTIVTLGCLSSLGELVLPVLPGCLQGVLGSSPARGEEPLSKLHQWRP